MKKRLVLSLSIVITASSLLMTACGSKNDTVSAMNNVSTETESIAESSTEIESSIAIEKETQSETESTIETQDETESSTETELSSVVGDETETTDSSDISESKLDNAVGDAKEGTFTVSDLDVTMYATQQCNIRKQPSIENEVIGSLLQTQEIKVTGKVNEVSWYRISLPDGTEGYISSTLLSSTKPSVQISTPTPSTAQEAATQAEQSVTPDQVINPNTGQPLKDGDVLPNGLTYTGSTTTNEDGSITFSDGTTYYPVD